MGFDAQEFRQGRVNAESEQNQKGYAFLYWLIGVGVLAVLALYVLGIKDKKSSITPALPPILVVETASVQQAVKTSIPTKAPITIEGEYKKYHQTLSVLRSCGKHFSYDRQYYSENNRHKYLQIAKLYSEARTRKSKAKNSLVPNSMTKSWNRLDNIDTQGDALKFIAKGGAMQHQKASMEMFAAMEKLTLQDRQNKIEHAAARTPKACIRLQGEVQRGKLNLKIPKL